MVLAEHMRLVRFHNTPDELCQSAGPFLNKCSRVVVLVDVPTSSPTGLVHFLDVVKRTWESYAQGSGGEGQQNRFRCGALRVAL